MATSETLTHGSTAWTNTQTQTAQTKTYTFATADKYVDKDIALTVTAQDATATASGASLTHGEITTTDTTYLTGTSSNGYAVTFSNDASVGAVSVNVSKAGWIDNGDITGISAGSTDTKTLTKYVKKGSASVKASQSIPVSGSITANGSTLTASLSGSKSITGSATAGWVTSVTSASVSASGTATANAADLDSNLVAGNIVKGVTIFGVTGTEANANDASFANVATADVSYTDVSSSAPILISGDYLYINEGYVGNQKISLAKLVPEKVGDVTVITDSTSNLIYNTVSALNNEGQLVAGTMGNATVKSGTASVTGVTVGALDTTTNKYPITVTMNVSAPTVSGTGYVATTADGGAGTLQANNSQSYTTSSSKGGATAMIAAGSATVAGGGLTAGTGSSSINVNKYWNGTSYDTADKITLSTSKASGYYEVGTTGKGSVSVADVTLATSAGYVPTATATTKIAGSSLDSNAGTSTYYIKKSTGATQTITPSNAVQTVTIGAGYYPSDRTITVNATSTDVLGNGALATTGSTISSVTATAGTATLNTTTWKYTVPMTLSASGTAYAKVSTNGYVTNANDTSASISGSGSANVVLDAYNGAFTIS